AAAGGTGSCSASPRPRPRSATSASAAVSEPRGTVGRVLRALALLSLSALVLTGGALATVTLPGFRSPSGNIRCFRNAEPPRVLHCSIGQAAYAKRLTAFCAAPPIGVDWGGFELGPARKATVTCTGGVLYDPSTQRLPTAVLAYGR